MRDLFVNLEVGEEVVDYLGENTRPVDRIDCAEMVFSRGRAGPRTAPSQYPEEKT